MGKTCKNCGREFNTDLDFLGNTQRWRKCSSNHLWFNCSCNSTMMLPKGKFPWYTPDLPLSKSAKSAFNTISNLEAFPAIPTQLMEIQQELANEELDVKKIVLSLRKLPVVAANVLQAAESVRLAKCSPSPPITNLEHAIVYVGQKELTNIITTAAVRSFELPKSSFDENTFWDESFVCGFIAEHLTKEYYSGISSDEAYFAAILCNIGKLALVFLQPDLAGRVENQVMGENVSWSDAEKESGIPDHSILGEILGCFWGLPTFVLDAASKHHRNPSDAKNYPRVEHIVSFANQLTKICLGQESRMDNQLFQCHKEKLQLTPKQMGQLHRQLTKIRSRYFGSIIKQAS